MSPIIPTSSMLGELRGGVRNVGYERVEIFGFQNNPCTLLYHLIRQRGSWHTREKVAHKREGTLQSGATTDLTLFSQTRNQRPASAVATSADNSFNPPPHGDGRAGQGNATARLEVQVCQPLNNVSPSQDDGYTGASTVSYSPWSGTT
jgi:hypothetical protein